MKIAIVGKGTSAIITTLVCLSEGHWVNVYYDPESSHLNVGESTLPQIGQLVFDVLGISISDMLEEDIVSLKSGVKFIDWGVGKSFYSNFQDKFAFHFNTSRFNSFINDNLKENGWARYIPYKVDSYKEKGDVVEINGEIYDFVIFCSGWNDDEYQRPLLNTVNSAVLYKKDSVDVDSTYTIHQATEDGWEFGLPFPKDGITKCGYLYDRDRISSEEVVDKLSHKGDVRKIEWTPQFSKRLIKNKNCAYNGNRLFFVEPLQALSLYYYYEFAREICQYLKEKNKKSFVQSNYRYQYEIWTYQLSLALHYRYGSIYDTSYWKDIEEDSKRIMSLPNGEIDTHITHMIGDLVNKDITLSNIGCFEAKDIQKIHCGMTDTSLQDLLDEYDFYE